MTRLLTDSLCTNCGLCCDGTLFADVELAGQDELARLEILGMDVENEGKNLGLLSQPCAALRGTRCGIYAHRPKCCRVFECRLLQDTQRGEIPFEEALHEVASVHEQIRGVRDLLGRLGNRDEDLPIKERCAETLSAADRAAPDKTKDLADLDAAMTTLEDTIWNKFLGSGKKRQR